MGLHLKFVVHRSQIARIAQLSDPRGREGSTVVGPARRIDPRRGCGGVGTGWNVGRIVPSTQRPDNERNRVYAAVLPNIQAAATCEFWPWNVQYGISLKPEDGSLQGSSMALSLLKIFVDLMLVTSAKFISLRIIAVDGTNKYRQRAPPYAGWHDIHMQNTSFEFLNLKWE